MERFQAYSTDWLTDFCREGHTQGAAVFRALQKWVAVIPCNTADLCSVTWRAAVVSSSHCSVLSGSFLAIRMSGALRAPEDPFLIPAVLSPRSFASNSPASSVRLSLTGSSFLQMLFSLLPSLFIVSYFSPALQPSHKKTDFCIP